jgi:hypothetical protein
MESMRGIAQGHLTLSRGSTSLGSMGDHDNTYGDNYTVHIRQFSKNLYGGRMFFQVRVIYRLRRHLRCCAHIHLAKRNLVPKLLRAYRRKLESELFPMVKFLHFSDNHAEKTFVWTGTVVGLWAWI